MTFQDTILECLKRLQKEVLMRGNELSEEELWLVFNGSKPETKKEIPRGKHIIRKRKRKKEEIEPEVELWRHGKYGALYLKCIKTNRLYDPNTEELVGKYHFDPDKELETVVIFED